MKYFLPVTLEIIFRVAHGSTVWPQPVSVIINGNVIPPSRPEVDVTEGLPRKFIADEVDCKEIAVAWTGTNFGSGSFQELLGVLRPAEAELAAVLDGDAAQVGGLLLLGCGQASRERADQQGCGDHLHLVTGGGGGGLAVRLYCWPANHLPGLTDWLWCWRAGGGLDTEAAGQGTGGGTSSRGLNILIILVISFVMYPSLEIK